MSLLSFRFSGIWRGHVRPAERRSKFLPAAARQPRLHFPPVPACTATKRGRQTPRTHAVTPASAFFTVHHNLWQVSMQGNGLGFGGTQNPPETEGERSRMAEGARESLCNHVEFFAWAPDDFGTLDPETNVW